MSRWLWLPVILVIAACGGGGAVLGTSTSVPELRSAILNTATSALAQDQSATLTGPGAAEAARVLAERRTELNGLDAAFPGLGVIAAASASRGLAQFNRWVFSFEGLVVNAIFERTSNEGTLSLRATGVLDGTAVQNFELMTATVTYASNRPVSWQYRRNAPFLTVARWTLTVTARPDHGATAVEYTGEALVNNVTWSVIGLAGDNESTSTVNRNGIRQLEVTTHTDTQSLQLYCESGELVILVLRNSTSAGGTVFGPTPCTPQLNGELEFTIL